MTSQRSGFTLLEAVVAMAIIAFVCVGIAELVSAQTRAAAHLRPALTGIIVARDRLASLELLSRNALVSLPDSMAAGAIVLPFAVLYWRASASAIVGERNLYKLAVVVSGDGQTTALETRVYRPNLAEAPAP